MNWKAGARPGLRLVWARFLQATGCFWWAKHQLRRRGAVAVLTFHRVLEDADFQRTSSLPAIIVRRRTFEKLAAFVAAKYDAVSFAEARRKRAGKLRVMFTFDDGWEDNYTNAMPVLHKRGIPSAVFVCPGLVGRTLPFWPEVIASLLGNAVPPASSAEIGSLIEALKTYSTERREQFIAGLYQMHAPAGSKDAYNGDRTVSWGDIREMAAAGVTIGCHTHTHQILTHVSAETARQEIRGAKRAIEAALRKPCDLFAYPNGNNSAATRRMLAEEGIGAAFTTQRGAWTGRSDPLAIPRVNICEATVTGPAGRFSPALFQYNVFWKVWRAMQAEQPAAAERHTEPLLSQPQAEPVLSSHTNLP